MSDTTLKQNKKLDELNYFNAIACLFVVLIHVLSLGITSLDRQSLQMAAVYIPWKLAAYVVPGFLFTGAVKMALGFGSGKPAPYLPYVWRRVTKIYLPYVVYVVIYFLYFVDIGWYVMDPKLLLHSIVFGDISSPFYYVVTVMQFYLLMPLWRWLVAKTPWFTTLPVCMLISFAMPRLGDVCAALGVTFRWSDRIFPTYVFFWVLGLYVGKYYGKVSEAITKHKTALMLCIVPSAAFAVMNYLQYKTNVFVYGADANCMKLVSDTLSIFFFLALSVIIKDSKASCLKRALSFIFSASFTVYLSHCYFLNVVDRQLALHGVTDIGVNLAVRALVCFTLPFLWFVIVRCAKAALTWLWRRVSPKKA